MQNLGQGGFCFCVLISSINQNTNASVCVSVTLSSKKPWNQFENIKRRFVRLFEKTSRNLSQILYAILKQHGCRLKFKTSEQKELVAQ